MYVIAVASCHNYFIMCPRIARHSKPKRRCLLSANFDGLSQRGQLRQLTVVSADTDCAVESIQATLCLGSCWRLHEMVEDQAWLLGSVSNTPNPFRATFLAQHCELMAW